MGSNSAIQHGTSLWEILYKFYKSAHFKYRTTLLTYLLVTTFPHQDGPLLHKQLIPNIHNSQHKFNTLT